MSKPRLQHASRGSSYKILFGDVSFAPPEVFVYQIGKIVESKNFDITKQTFDKINGFTFSDETNILRYVSMGNTVYDVSVPDDALVFSYITPETNKPCFITTSNLKFIAMEAHDFSHWEEIAIFS